MRSLASRIDRFERNQPPCPKCGGKGKVVTCEMQEGDPDPVPDPAQGCDVCGEVALIIFKWMNEPAVPGGTVPKELIGRKVPKGLFH